MERIRVKIERLQGYRLWVIPSTTSRLHHFELQTMMLFPGAEYSVHGVARCNE